MRMVIAVDNEVLEERLKNRYYLDYEIIIVKSMDMALKETLRYKESILVIKDELKGNYTFESLITKVKSNNNRIQVIALVRELTKKLKEILYANEVFSIIEGNDVDFYLLTDLIDNPKMIVYKKINNNSHSKVILVTGGRGVGKTITAITLGKTISRIKKDYKIVVLDLDLIYPSIDIYIDLTNNYSLVDYINDVLKDKTKKMDNYESSDKKYNNLKYILNSKSIGIPQNEIIVKMIRKLEDFYDYVIVDTSSLMINKIYNIAKSNNYSVVLVINNAPKSVRDFKEDTAYINIQHILNSIVICNNVNFLYNFKKYSKEYGVEIVGKLGNVKYIKNKNKFKESRLKCRMNNVLKKLGIIRFEKVKLKIVKKILGLEE